MSARRAQVVLAAIALAVGAAGVWLGRELDMTAPQGVEVAGFLRFNPISSFVTALLGAISLAGVASERRGLSALAGIGFLIAALIVVMGAGQETSLFAGTGANAGFFLGLGGGLLALGASWE